VRRLRTQIIRIWAHRSPHVHIGALERQNRTLPGGPAFLNGEGRYPGMVVVRSSMGSEEKLMEQDDRDGPFGADVAVTHILVVADPARSRDFWVNVLGAEPYREYGGTSVVLRFAGTWVLLVTGGPPTADKPGVVFGPPADPDLVSHAMTLRSA